MTAHVDPGSIKLRDGRRLAFAATGPRDGALVLYLHGAIGSPQCGCPELDAIVDELGIRYVMVSRPGFAGSDPLPGRSLRDFAADAAQLADRLGHERFCVVGVSAGGPYALACAHELPQRVAVATVVSSMPWACAPDLVAGLDARTRVALRLLRRTPRTCTRTADALVGVARRHPRLVARVIGAGEGDAGDVRARDEAGARFLDAAGRGVGAMVEDYGLCAGDWGFAPRDVRPAVQLWHGAKDPLVPVDQALLLAAALPRARVAIDPDEGHFFYRRRLREILGELFVDTPAVKSASSR
jgi:pimeloyl-ACP methyl ester carboxylesterase